jgi:hypothetical protein
MVTISTPNSRPIANLGRINMGLSVKSVQHASYEYDNMQNPTSFSRSFVLDKAGTYTAQFIVNDTTIDGDPVAVTISCTFWLLRTP